MFSCVGVLYDRMHSRMIKRLRRRGEHDAVVRRVLASCSRWPTPACRARRGFVGEFMVILASFQTASAGRVRRRDHADHRRGVHAVAGQARDLRRGRPTRTWPSSRTSTAREALVLGVFAARRAAARPLAEAADRPDGALHRATGRRSSPRPSCKDDRDDPDRCPPPPTCCRCCPRSGAGRRRVRAADARPVPATSAAASSPTCWRSRSLVVVAGDDRRAASAGRAPCFSGMFVARHRRRRAQDGRSCWSPRCRWSTPGRTCASAACTRASSTCWCCSRSLGMMLMVSAGSLVMVYLGLEMLALCSYALVAIDRDSPLASEAAMKYFVLGALASGLLLYGMSLVYGATGTLDLARDPCRRGRDAASRTLLLTRRGVHGRRHRLQVRRRAVPHVAARRLPRRADADHAVHRLGAEAGGVRHGLPPARSRRRPARRRTGSMMLAGLAVAVAGDRQPGRDGADQPQAHARRTRPSRTSASCSWAWPAAARRVMRRRCSMRSATRSWRPAAFGAIVLLSRRGFEADQHRRLQGPERAQPVARGAGAVRDGLAGRRAAVPRLLGQARGAARRARRRTCCGWRSSASCSR